MKNLLFVFAFLAPLAAHNAWAAPAGTASGACYGNSTCNQGLSCDALSNQCVAPNAIADGSDGGACYGNSTCNQGLSCDAMSNQCVAPSVQPPMQPPAQPPMSQGPMISGSAPQPPVPPPLPTRTGYEYNSGFMIGLGLGSGLVSCEDCDSESGLSYDINVGGFLNPRLAVMLDFSAWDHSDFDLTLSNTTVAAQYWLGPKWWIKGGLGVSTVSNEYDSETGVGLTSGVGLEVMQSGSFALDVSARLNVFDFDEQTFTGLHGLLGVRWK